MHRGKKKLKTGRASVVDTVTDLQCMDATVLYYEEVEARNMILNKRAV